MEKDTDVNAVTAQGQTDLSVVLDQIEQRASEYREIPEELSEWINQVTDDNAALVKALRRAMRHAQMVDDTTPDWRGSAQVLGRELTTLLTSPAETKKDL